MKLFSKRHSERRLGMDRIHYRRNVRSNELISEEARNRLVSEIKFLSSRDDYLEWFILFQDDTGKEKKISYDDVKLNDFSMAELGYKMTDTFNLYPEFEMKQSFQTLRYASESNEPEAYYDDYRLFDIAEMTILFSKKPQRKHVIDRINSILEEENADYEIVEHLITRRSGDDLKGMLGILKDNNLKAKIERFFEYFSKGDHINAAKISADIVNIIFSDVKESGKKKRIEEMKNKLAGNLVTSKSEDKLSKIAGYIDNALTLSRSLNNDIYDVRHTEQSTLKPKGDNLYKMISRQNLTIIELTLTALKDDFVLSDDWENIKAEYTKKYNIDTNLRRVRSRPKEETPIDLSEIPF